MNWPSSWGTPNCIEDKTCAWRVTSGYGLFDVTGQIWLCWLNFARLSFVCFFWHKLKYKVGKRFLYVPYVVISYAIDNLSVEPNWWKKKRAKSRCMTAVWSQMRKSWPITTGEPMHKAGMWARREVGSQSVHLAPDLKVATCVCRAHALAVG